MTSARHTGGGFCTGAGATRWTDAARLARRGDAIVVSLNYRLGPLGFASDGIDGGANGLRDVIEALKFVKEVLVEPLGGGSTMTVFGESSGAVAVCALSASPAAAGLIDRAVVQSDPARVNQTACCLQDALCS